VDSWLGVLTHDLLVIGGLVLGVVIAISLGVWFLNSTVD
jgi:ABC-type proline/glycine betaine transport system permease subunit